MPCRLKREYILCGLLLIWPGALLADFSRQQLEWLESDAEHPTDQVNEGTLTFLPAAAGRAEHQQFMQIKITDETITSGWAAINQCHENLDRVEKLEIVFHKMRVKNLRVTEYRNIGRAWSEGHRVVVRNVQKDSKICLRAQSRIFRPLQQPGKPTQFEMTNGPFMRRFLDGFYPLNLSLDISYPPERLQIKNVIPVPQPGWEISYDAGRIFLRGRFEGKLSTRLQFILTR